MAKKNKVTPVAPCMFPWLTKPKTQMGQGDNAINIDPIYTVDLVFDQDDKWVKALEKHATKLYKEAKSKLKPAQQKKVSLYLPVKPEEDRDSGEETGRVKVTFKTYAEFKNKQTGEISQFDLPIVDAKGRRLNKKPNIGSGSKLAVAFNSKLRLVKGVFYFTLYMNAVQLIELVEFGADYGFESQEGGFEADDSEEESEFDQGGGDIDDDEEF